MNWTDIRTSLTIDSKIESVYQLPSIVMSTAATPLNEGAPMEFSWDSEDAATAEYYIYMHFAEIVKLQANQSRSFNITLNGNYWYGPLVPDYLSTISLYSPDALSGQAKYDFSIFKTDNSTLPPIINAIEIYTVKYLLQSDTYQGDGTFVPHITHIYIYIYICFSLYVLVPIYIFE